MKYCCVQSDQRSICDCGKLVCKTCSPTWDSFAIPPLCSACAAKKDIRKCKGCKDKFIYGKTFFQICPTCIVEYYEIKMI